MNKADPYSPDAERPGLRPPRQEGSRMSQQHTDPPSLPTPLAPPPGRPQTDSKPSVQGTPSFQVVLLTDNLHDFQFIIQTIMDLTRLSRSDATHKMWQAHNGGRSVLLSTNRERAELYAEQFASKGLRVVIERV